MTHSPDPPRPPLTDPSVSVEDFARLMEQRAGRLDRMRVATNTAMMLGMLWCQLRGLPPRDDPRKKGRSGD